MSRTALTLAVLAVLVGGAGCSSDDEPSASATTSGTSNDSGALPGCPSAATMQAELGLSLQEPKVNGSDPVRACMYEPAAGSSSGNAIVRFQGKNDAAQFAQAKAGFPASGQTADDISGVGDEAFSSTKTIGGSTNYTIVARKGSLEILVTSHASLDKEKAFINKLFG